MLDPNGIACIHRHATMVRFGQVVVGPPGSGKTTYCLGMFQYLKAIGRDAAIINLDPANHGEGVPYTPEVDIEDLVSLETVMGEFNLGPNGAMLYCLEYLERNVDWLVEKLEGLGHKKYLIFDLPGQVELFTHCFCVQNVVQRLQKEDIRLAAVHLVDAYYCSNPSLFISAALLSLMVMLRLELPHVNVLSKVDLVEQMGPLPFNLEFFTECQDMQQLLAYLDAPPNVGGDDRSGGAVDAGQQGPDRESSNESGRSVTLVAEPARQADAPLSSRRGRKRFKKLTEEICDVVDSYGLVCFLPLNIQDAETVGRVLAQIDKCNGYILGSHDTAAPGGASGTGVSNLFRTAFSDTHEPMFERIGSIQERYMPESFGGVPPEFLMSGTGDARVNVQSERSSPSQTEKPGD